MTGIGKQFILSVALLLLALLSVACHRSSPLKRLRDIDSLVNARPDSALTLLNTLLPDTNQMSKRTLMRFHLLRTNAENKCDTVLTARHAALMRRVCDYYDHRSSKHEANNRMLAHYLLGRCYDDMGEAPAALYEFNNAADVADTTYEQCDYKTLMRVHSQMANMFYMQDLYDRQLSELYKVIALSKKARDFKSEMWPRESVATALDAKGKGKESLQMLERIHWNLLQHGYRAEAARTSGVALSILVDLGCYGDIGPKLYEYEHFSGFFDAAGSIEPSKALYYVYKGKYLLHCGKTDSAVMLFRKCLSADYPLETRLSGAVELDSFYSKAKAGDSIVKYARFSARLSDSLRRKMWTAALARQENSHKYISLQSQADQLRMKNEQARYHRQLLLSTLIVILLLGGYVGVGWYIRIKSLKREKEEKQKELERIKRSYQTTLERHEEALSVLQLLKEEKAKNTDALKHYQEDIDERERDLAELTSEIILLKKQLTEAESKISQHEMRLTIQRVDTELAHFDTLQLISDCLSATPPRRLSLVDLRHLREEFREKYPSFYQKLVIEHELTLKKYDICLLYRLNIKSSSIAILLGVGRSSVTMERHRIYESIFGRYDEEGEFETFLNSIV